VVVVGFFFYWSIIVVVCMKYKLFYKERRGGGGGGGGGGSAIGIATGLQAGRSRLRIPVGARYFSLPHKTARPTVDPTQSLFA